jgi:hypothetical protein
MIMADPSRYTVLHEISMILDNYPQDDSRVCL